MRSADLGIACQGCWITYAPCIGRNLRAVELPGELTSEFCKTLLRGYAENEIQGQRSKRRSMKGILIGAIVIILLLVGGAYWYFHRPQFQVVVPEYQPPPEQLVRAEQGWTGDERLHFHH